MIQLKRTTILFGKFSVNFLSALISGQTEWSDRLTLFVAYLIHKNKQSSTVKSYISMIKSVLRDCNVEINEDQYLTSSLTRACKLQNDQVKMWLPISKGMLKILLREIDSKWLDQLNLATLYKTIYSTMCYGLLRISEVAGSHSVLTRDVHVGANKKKFLLVLRTSKTHWKNMKPQMIKISTTPLPKEPKVVRSDETESEFCPYSLLQKYAKFWGNYSRDNEPFFLLPSKRPVTPLQIHNTLKDLLNRSGFNNSLYSSHSLRIGRSSDLAKLGLSVETIKKKGRWRSNAVYHYLRD